MQSPEPEEKIITLEEQPQLRIPLREERGKYKKLIGYYYPERNWITTPNGNWSVPGTSAHKKRLEAAYVSRDFTYRAES